MSGQQKLESTFNSKAALKNGNQERGVVKMHPGIFFQSSVDDGHRNKCLQVHATVVRAGGGW